MPKLAESLKNKEFAGCVGIPGIGLEDIAGKRRSTAWEAGYIYAASRFFGVLDGGGYFTQTVT